MQYQSVSLQIKPEQLIILKMEAAKRTMAVKGQTKISVNSLIREAIDRQYPGVEL